MCHDNVLYQIGMVALYPVRTFQVQMVEACAREGEPPSSAIPELTFVWNFIPASVLLHDRSPGRMIADMTASNILFVIFVIMVQIVSLYQYTYLRIKISSVYE